MGHRPMIQNEVGPFSTNNNSAEGGRDPLSLPPIHTSPPPIIASTAGTTVVTVQTGDNKPSGTILASTAGATRRSSGPNSIPNPSGGGVTRNNSGRGRLGSGKDGGNQHYQYPQGHQSANIGGVVMNSQSGSQDGVNGDLIPLMEGLVSMSTVGSNAVGPPHLEFSGPISLEVTNLPTDLRTTW